MSDFPDELQRILRDSFALRTTLTRKTGQRRTIETTYWWDGAREIALSGFPGKRDWVASLARNPAVVIHTVEIGAAGAMGASDGGKYKYAEIFGNGGPNTMRTTKFVTTTASKQSNRSKALPTANMLKPATEGR